MFGMKAVLRKRPAIRDWNDVQFTLAVAQTGSFRAAASHLGVHQTTVSRRVERLERELATKLFLRRAHGMVLTAAGQSLIEKATAMENVATVVRSEVAGQDARLVGTIRVAVPEALGVYWLIPALAEFQLSYPEIFLEVFTEVRAAQSTARESDIFISMVRPDLPRLIALQVGFVHYNLFASRKYLRQWGCPKSIEELREHCFVDVYLYRTVSHLAWWNRLIAEVGKTVLVTDSSSLFLSSIQEGLGIGMAPTFCKVMLPELVPLPLAPECGTELWLVRHEATKKSAKISVLGNFLKMKFTRDRTRWFNY
jgi:DNA-binding transcriptional LysR family regulator